MDISESSIDPMELSVQYQAWLGREPWRYTAKWKFDGAMNLSCNGNTYNKLFENFAEEPALDAYYCAVSRLH